MTNQDPSPSSSRQVGAVNDPTGAFHWALPGGLDIDPDQLKLRLDFYEESIVLQSFDGGVTTVRLVSATDIARAVTRDGEFFSGFLPKDALWWRSSRGGHQVAVWRPAKVWRVALQEEAFKPPRRFSLPMPGLVFVCTAAQPPAIYAAKRKPTSPEALVYKAPTFNAFSNGLSCQGTHHYGADLDKIPEEFFASFFSGTGDTEGRSQKHPKNLLALWEELDGKKAYPLDDLVEQGTIKDLLQGRLRR